VNLLKVHGFYTPRRHHIFESRSNPSGADRPGHPRNCSSASPQARRADIFRRPPRNHPAHRDNVSRGNPAITSTRHLPHASPIPQNGAPERLVGEATDWENDRNHHVNRRIGACRISCRTAERSRVSSRSSNSEFWTNNRQSHRPRAPHHPLSTFA